jgi:hypothetical protein
MPAGTGDDCPVSGDERLRWAWEWESGWGQGVWEILPPQAYAPLRAALTAIMLAKRTNLVAIPVIQKDMTVRAIIFILRYSWSTDR